jgi:DNA helicase-2/ATP-dependent DNA helicase PcrA
VLTERAAALVARHGQPAEAVLVITFTNRAAAELRGRLAVLLGSDAERMTVGTFHAVCHRLLRAHAEQRGAAHASRSTTARPAGGWSPRRSRSCTPTRSCRCGWWRSRSAAPRPGCSARTSTGRCAIASRPAWSPPLTSATSVPWSACDALDFDDLIARSVVLLGEPDLAARYRRRWQAILVDEHQDTNPAQYEVVRRLAAGHRNLTVAGDDDQAIYRFRSAEVRNLLDFERDFPGARVVALERNYRSAGAIVTAAARLAAHNRRAKRQDDVDRRASGTRDRGAVLRG